MVVLGIRQLQNRPCWQLCEQKTPRDTKQNRHVYFLAKRNGLASVLAILRQARNARDRVIFLTQSQQWYVCILATFLSMALVAMLKFLSELVFLGYI